MTWVAQTILCLCTFTICYAGVRGFYIFALSAARNTIMGFVHSTLHLLNAMMAYESPPPPTQAVVVLWCGLRGRKVRSGSIWFQRVWNKNFVSQWKTDFLPDFLRCNIKTFTLEKWSLTTHFYSIHLLIFLNILPIYFSHKIQYSKGLYSHFSKIFSPSDLLFYFPNFSDNLHDLSAIILLQQMQTLLLKGYALIGYKLILMGSYLFRLPFWL